MFYPASRDQALEVIRTIVVVGRNLQESVCISQDLRAEAQ